MVWREAILDRILGDLGRDVPEFVTVIAPAQSGKTTLALQLMARMSMQHRSVLPVFLDMGCLGQNATEDAVARYVVHAISAQLPETSSACSRLIEPALQPIDKFQADLNASFDDLALLLGELLPNFPEHTKLLLLVDEIGSLPEVLQSALLIFFRSLHANRLTNDLLRNVSVALFSTRSLTIKHLGEVSPYNVSKEYVLPDLTRQEVVQFLNGCQALLDGMEFNAQAVDYLYEQTHGHAILVQKICAEATKSAVASATIRIRDVLNGVVSCFETQFITTLLDVDELPAPALDSLLRLLFQEPVLPWHDVARLLERGIAKMGTNHRCEFRSPLLHAMLVSKFAPTLMQLHAIPGLTHAEECLVALPQVAMLLVNKPLERMVIERLEDSEYAADESLFETAYAEEAFQILSNLDPLFDEQGVQFFLARYFADYIPKTIDKTDVLRLVARVFAKRRRQRGN